MTDGRMWIRVTGAALLMSGAAVAVFDRPARADAPTLGAFSVTATAPGSQYTYDFPGAQAHPEAEGEAPESQAQLRSGPQGYALSSVAWPGALAANAGSLSQLVNLPIPSSAASDLNEPIRAEARTGSGPPSVTNDSYPGIGMSATATASQVSADTTMAGSSGPTPQSHSGNSESQSTAAISGPDQVTSTAYSLVQNVNLAGGLVTIKSVTSTATATATPTGATASGSTVVSGLAIAGQPAYIDDHGVHLGQSGPGAPVNQVASSIAQQALTQAGMKIAVSEPIEQKQGSSISFDAGNVVFFFAPPHDTNGDTFTSAFGGASVTASASSGFPATGFVPPAPIPVAGATSAPVPAAPSAVTGAGPTPAATGTPAPTVPPTTEPSTTVPAGSPAVIPASSGVQLPHGIPPIAPVLVILGALLSALGMRRLPDRVLEATSTSCPLGGEQ